MSAEEGGHVGSRAHAMQHGEEQSESKHEATGKNSNTASHQAAQDAAAATEAAVRGSGGAPGGDTEEPLDVGDTPDDVSAEVGAGVGGGMNGAAVFAHARESTRGTAPTNKPSALGLLVDIDPRHPAFLSATTGVVVMLSWLWWWRRKKIGNNTHWASRGGNDGVGGVGGGVGGVGGGVGGDVLLSGTPSPNSGARYNTRGHRVVRAGSGTSASRQRSAGKVMILTPEQVSLCEVLYDVYAGVIPGRGIDSRAVRDSGLTAAEIRRQFKNIKHAREEAATRTQLIAAGGGELPRSPSTPILVRSAKRNQSAEAEPARGKGPARSPSGTRSSKGSSGRRPPAVSPKSKPPVSPRKTPVKRGAASRRTPSPKSGSSVAKRAAAAGGEASPSKPSKRSPSTPDSPMVTRGKDNRAPSARQGSPKSTLLKTRAASAAGGGGGRKTPASPKSTPSKRGSPSVLEVARREAQSKADAVANARASSLTGAGTISTAVTRSKRARP